MKKAAAFIVRFRYIILGIMLALAVISGIMIPKVNINDDMTKYLSDASNMKQGIDIMEKDFSDLPVSNVIRVMFTGLDRDQKLTIADELEAIPYVDSVAYEIDDADYNKDDLTLYEINTEYDFDSDQETSIRETIAEKYDGHDYTAEQQGSTKTQLPAYVIIIAISILMAILFAMSGSWFEPVIFMMVIGIAIVLNMGTNIFKPSVSQTTFAIAAILQLVLSMDYSIILMNRYRQELKYRHDRKDAMTMALTNAFSSVTSSAVTTFVGLLMLVFMSFKIGADLGIVLAKGVICSLVCVLTILPALIMIFEPVIRRTSKPVLHIPVGGLAKAEHKARFILTPVFILLFTGAFILQNNTAISFGMEKTSQIEEHFPSKNSLVVLYNNKDEAKIRKITDALDEDENVRSAISYPTLFAKQQTAGELSDMIDDMGSDTELEPFILRLVYYKYHNGGNLPALRIAELLDFIADDVVTNRSFSEYMNEDIKNNIDQIKKFTDRKELTRKMSIGELADFFDMKADDLKKMFILYYGNNEGGNISDLTMKEFVDFLSNDIMNDPDYSSFVSDEMNSRIDTFKALTDKAVLTTPYTYDEAAGVLGTDPSQMRLLYVYYHSLQEGYDPGSMTLPEFVSFLNNDIINDPAFSSYIDQSSASQLQTFSKFADPAVPAAQMNAAQMSSLIGIDAAQVESIYSMYYGETKADGTRLTLDTFLSFILGNETFTSNVTAEQLAQLRQMESLASLVKSQTPLPPAQLAALLGMDEPSVSGLIRLYGASIPDPSVSAVPLSDFIGFLVTNVMNDPMYAPMFDEQTKSSLTQMYHLLQTIASGADFSYQEMADILQMDPSMARSAYVICTGSAASDKTMSPIDMISFMLSDPTISAQFDQQTLSQMQMLQQLMSSVVSGSSFTYAQMAELTGLDPSMMKMLYTVHSSKTSAPSWRIPVNSIVAFISENSGTFGSMAGGYSGQISLLEQIINAVLSDKRFDHNELASMLGMSSADFKQMFLLYTSKYGDTSDWGLSPQEFVKFIISDILTNEDYASAIDKDSANSLKDADKLIDAVVSDKIYTPKAAAGLLSGLSEDLDTGKLKLLYTYYGSRKIYNENWTMSLREMVDYLNHDLLNDPDFSDLIDDEAKESLGDMDSTLQDAIDQIRGKNYSLLSITTSYPAESGDTFAFLKELHSLCDRNLENDHYIIGSSAMYYEMSNEFKSEMMLITLLTAIAIFIIILITFRSLIVPTILVLIVQCAVFITVAVSFLQGYAINYLAYLIVQCILMGATIDYGILFTNNYMEYRLYHKENTILNSLKYAYESSMHTILTSGLIMIIITGIIGAASTDPAIGPICQTISIGALSAVILIVFLLPAILALFDRFFIRRRLAKLHRQSEEEGD